MNHSVSPRYYSHLVPLPSPVGLEVSSVGLPGFSSSSSPLTLAPTAAFFFLNVAGTMSAGKSIEGGINKKEVMEDWVMVQKVK